MNIPKIKIKQLIHHNQYKNHKCKFRVKVESPELLTSLLMKIVCLQFLQRERNYLKEKHKNQTMEVIVMLQNLQNTFLKNLTRNYYFYKVK